VIECRRFGQARVDCAYGTGKSCQAPYSVTLRGVLIYLAQYICRSRSRPFLVRNPSTIARPIVAPLL